MTSIRVRKLEPVDRDAVASLWSQVFGYAEARNDPARVLAAKLAWDERVLVAVEGSSLLGSVMIGFDGHRGWLYRVTQNLAFSTLRRERSFGQRLNGLFSSREEADASTPEVALARQEKVGRAMAALNALPGQERVVLAMKVLDGSSQREIAAALGLSEGYVSKLLSRAQARLSSGEWKVDDDTP